MFSATTGPPEDVGSVGVTFVSLHQRQTLSEAERDHMKGRSWPCHAGPPVTGSLQVREAQVGPWSCCCQLLGPPG